jgi:HD-GYP domain-containing protein (c-di-GMP phosphodiesterase class II)
LACERRKNVRHPFHITDEKTIQVRLDSKSYFLKTLDVSENGAAVFLSKEQRTHFNKDTKVWIDTLGDHRLTPPMVAKIASVFPYTLKHQNVNEVGFKAGIQLEGVFPVAPFTKFLVRPSLYAIEDSRLLADTVFRAKVHEVMGSTLQNIMKKRSTKTLFYKIDFDRADPDYVKLHIKLLCELLCGVGTKMGWISDKTLDKLIYVAYMHDVSLFNQPKLAKIQSKAELERAELTADEKKLVLDAPLYAAELARQDQQSYPDAVKILLQQRELPDGSGFPYGINGSQLTPLSCLFIF